MTVVLLFLHLVAASFWVGGMAVMHFAVRPAALALDPPQRLPFMAQTLARFFAGVMAAIVVLLASGVWMVMLVGGFGRVHWSVHAMFGLGLLMMALFLHIRFALYPKLQRAVAAAEWPVAAARLGSIRMLVAVNLGLGVVVFAVAILGRVQ